jgi:hypothetical protein
MLERGLRVPSITICLRVADALGLNLHDLLKDVAAKKGGRRK